MTDPVGPPPSRAQRLLWGEPESPRRGPKPTLTLQAIADAAIRIADDDGLEACTMARLAKALGVSAMALYRYVDTKSDLSLLMFDAAYGPPTEPTTRTGDWRDQLTAFARTNHRVLTAHPWLLQLPLDGPPVTPNTLRWLNAGLAALKDLPLPNQDKLSVMLLIEVFVRGQAQLLAQGLNAPNAQYGPRLMAALPHLDLPHLEAAARSGTLEDDDDAETEFTRGLDFILDGVAARIGAAR